MFSDHVAREFLDSCARIRRGSLRLTTPDGNRYDFGAREPHGEMEIHDWSSITAAAARGDIGLGESYVAGLWDTPSIQAITEVALLNLTELGAFTYAGFWQSVKFRLIDRILRRNSQRGAARNIRRHYDVGNEFYQLWLDPSMTYSSALFGEDDDLQRAQFNKYDRILDRLSDRGERVLEIGCGWGGFAERAADRGHRVTGLTISPSQKAWAEARLGGRADIRLQDYRSIRGTFDNLVSIEMIEAVGQAYWPQYFATIRERLAEGGRAVIQAITVDDGYFDVYRKTSDYIRHYTFPGGMLLSDAHIRDQARRAGLAVRDIFAFGQHYARTCATWAAKLEDQAERIRTMGYDETFLRSWRFYLGICAASFSVRQTDVVQVELAHT